MNEVLEEFVVKQNTILRLDGEFPQRPYKKYKIDGKEYKIVPVYDLPHCIAIEATGNFIGKFVEFM